MSRVSTDTPVFDLGLPRWADSLVRPLLGFAELEARYRRVARAGDSTEGVGLFCERALGELGVGFPVADETVRALCAVPGPLLFVANHPFGGLDALLLMALVGRVRSDFRFVANANLAVIPQLSEALVPVHIMAATRSPHQQVQANIAPLRAALRYLREGGALAMFPAGEVAEQRSLFASNVTERAWSPLVGALVRHTHATVVPVHFSGQNSALFRYGGSLFPSLRIALLARELLAAKADQRFAVGAPVASDTFIDASDAEIAHRLQYGAAALARGRV